MPRGTARNLRLRPRRRTGDQGWDDGVAGMKVGGRRTHHIPPHKGYGASGAGGVSRRRDARLRRRPPQRPVVRGCPSSTTPDRRWRSPTRRPRNATVAASSPTSRPRSAASPPPATTVPGGDGVRPARRHLRQRAGQPDRGRAWFARARRLVERRAAVHRAGLGGGGRDGLRRRRPRRAAGARPSWPSTGPAASATSNLETKALADGGLAHVQAGRIAEGMAMLDEAMALACGPADDAEAAGQVGVLVLHRLLLRRRLRAGRVVGRPAPPARPDRLGARARRCSCRATATACRPRCSSSSAGGARPRRVLTRARAEFEAVMPCRAGIPTSRLADLRIRQGRLADAEALLLGKDQAIAGAAAGRPAAPGPRRPRPGPGRPPGGACGSIGDDRLRAVELLAVLVDAELAAGDLDAAAAACAELAERIARPRRRRRSRARAAAARARVAGRRRRPRRRRSPCSRRRVDRARPAPSCPGCAPRCCSSWPGCASAPATRRRRGSTPRRRPRVLRRARRRARRRPTPRCSTASARRRAGERRAGATADAGARRHVVVGVVRRDERAPPRHARACATWPSWSAHPASSATRSTSSTGSRASTPTAASTAARSAMPASCSTRTPAAAYRRRIEELRAEIDDALAAGPLERGRGAAGRARPARRRSWPRPSAWAAATGGRRRPPSGPGSTSPGRCGRRSPGSPRRCPRPAPPSTGGSAPASTAPTSRSTTTSSAGSFSPD